MFEVSNDVKLDFSDVRLEPRFSSIDSRSKVVMTREFHMPHSGDVIKGMGIIAANMDGVGTFAVAHRLAQHEVFTAIHKNYSVVELVDFYMEHDQYGRTRGAVNSFYSMGITDADYDKLRIVSKTPGVVIDKICIDVANGYMDDFYEFIKRIRNDYPFVTLMVGNVVTPEAVTKAHEYGADIVKLGIGPGAMCTTRLQTGIGYPQLSAIMDCRQAADEAGILLCSDGGCANSGDVAIAIAAGADFVMLGTMLAGTDEGGGDVVDGKVMFYGMSSKTANTKHFGGLKDYRSSEGRTAMIPYKGAMDDVIRNILGGIRSTCTYTGCLSIGELPYRAKANRVNNTHNRAYEHYTIGN